MIRFIKGDLTKMKVDAIVNAANTALVGGEGLCGAIHDAAGPELDKECSKLKYCLRGDAKITLGYNLPAKHIIHTVGPVYGQHSGKESEILYSCYYEALRLAENEGVETIAFPYISTGIYRYPFEDAKAIAVVAINDYIDDNPYTTLLKVYLVTYVPGNN